MTTSKIDLALEVTPSAVAHFSDVLDAERLVRLHPHWHVEALTNSGEGFVARLKDHVSENIFEFSFKLTFPNPHEIMIVCNQGPAESIHFFVEKGHLHVAFNPHGEGLATEEEQNLTLWIQSIRQYLRLYVRTTPYTRFFRALMNKAFLKMDPSQRKICLMLYRFTLLEVVVILIIVIGYFAFG